MKRRGFLQTLFGAAAPTIGTVLAKLPVAAPVVAAPAVSAAAVASSAGATWALRPNDAKALWPGIKMYWEEAYSQDGINSQEVTRPKTAPSVDSKGSRE